MHLSMLNTGYISDIVADVPALVAGERSFGQMHRDGLLRGALFTLALAVPLALTIALSPAEEARPAQPDAVHVRITHLATR